jgi:hypothetical protein
MRKGIVRRRVMLLSFLVAPLGAFGGAVALAGSGTGAQASGVTTSSLGQYSPTFVGAAATGCASGCSLLSGPIYTTSTASGGSSTAAANPQAATPSSYAHGLPAPNLRARPGVLATGNGYGVQANNIGEILVFNTAWRAGRLRSPSTRSWG